MIITPSKLENYTIIPNNVARDKGLSARAKGIYFYLATLPNDWKLSKKECMRHFTEGRDAFNKAFKELETLGYVTKKQVRDEGKFLGYDYIVNWQSTVKHEESTTETDNQITVNQSTVNQNTGNQLTENPTLLIKEELNTKRVINNKLNTCTKEDIEAIYNEYPKKIGKASALKAIEKALTKVRHHDLFLIVKEYAQCISWKDKQYIPNPTTWFNQERWTDDRSAWLPPNQKGIKENFSNKQYSSELF